MLGLCKSKSYTILKILSTWFKLDFNIIPGRSNIMVSAPHCVEQYRNGKFKLPEDLTLPVARHLSNENGTHIIYKTKCIYDDANYDDKSSYRDSLVEYVKRNNVSLLFDLHGLSSKRSQDIIIGTDFSLNCQGYYWVAKVIKSYFSRTMLLNVVIDEVFTASNPNTVSNDIHTRTGIPTFQLEINRRVLMSRMKSFLKYFSEVVILVERDICESCNYLNIV